MNRISKDRFIIVHAFVSFTISTFFSKNALRNYHNVNRPGSRSETTLVVLIWTQSVCEDYQHRCVHILNEKTYLRGFDYNKGADQPAHPRSLISAFVNRLLESFISRHAISNISIF